MRITFFLIFFIFDFAICFCFRLPLPLSSSLSSSSSATTVAKTVSFSSSSSSSPELETYKRLAVVAQLDLSNERIKTQALQCSLDAKPNRDLANAVLRRENEMLKRRAEILSNLYFKLSDFVVDSTGEAIGYGLFCNIDITEFDIGMYLLDFIGFERMMTENEKNGRFRNKYLLSIGKGRVLDCQKKAKANICMASRCNQARGLRGKPTMHLEIVYDPPHFKIIAAASANSELLTTYHGIV